MPPGAMRRGALPGHFKYTEKRDLQRSHFLMDWFPLLNTLRVAAAGALAALAPAAAAANAFSRLPRPLRGLLELLLTLPLFLSPAALGWLLLALLGTDSALGGLLLRSFAFSLTGRWWSALFAVVPVCFPLIYHLSRAALARFDESQAEAARALGLSERWIFRRLRLPAARGGILLGLLLAFARALGECGAGSMLAGSVPGAGVTVGAEVRRLWLAGDSAGALRWVLTDAAVSAAVLLAAGIWQHAQEGRK